MCCGVLDPLHGRERDHQVYLVSHMSTNSTSHLCTTLFAICSHRRDGLLAEAPHLSRHEPHL